MSCGAIRDGSLAKPRSHLAPAGVAWGCSHAEKACCAGTFGQRSGWWQWRLVVAGCGGAEQLPATHQFNGMPTLQCLQHGGVGRVTATCAEQLWCYVVVSLAEMGSTWRSKSRTGRPALVSCSSRRLDPNGHSRWFCSTSVLLAADCSHTFPAVGSGRRTAPELSSDNPHQSGLSTCVAGWVRPQALDRFTGAGVCNASACAVEPLLPAEAEPHVGCVPCD